MADIISRKLLQHQTVILEGIVQEDKDDWLTIDPNPNLPGPVLRVHRSSIRGVWETGQKIKVHGEEEALKQILIAEDATIIRMDYVKASDWQLQSTQTEISTSPAPPTKVVYFQNLSNTPVNLCGCKKVQQTLFVPDSWIVIGTDTGQTELSFPHACPSRVPWMLQPGKKFSWVIQDKWLYATYCQFQWHGSIAFPAIEPPTKPLGDGRRYYVWLYFDYLGGKKWNNYGE